MDVQTPDYLIGLGGTGCKIVEEFMSRDWVIHDLVKREAGGEDVQLNAYTIDTATGDWERADRDDAEEEIVNNIKRTRKKFPADLDVPEDLPLEDYSDVVFEHYNYVEDTPSFRTSKKAMIGHDGVNELLENSDRLENTWWLKDHPDLLTDNFANGVLRRRTLSKALYHVSRTHSDTHPANDLPISADESVLMVTALGGGTGSGSFIDLAADIHPDASIHLLAITPDAGYGRAEGGDELASAHAALSELEYLELNNDSPFTSITLLPYHERDDIENKDFEDAVVHTILAHQNTWEENGSQYLAPSDGANAISDLNTFNVAVPRIIRYDAGVRERARDDVERYIQERKGHLDVEQGLYEAVERYLSTNFPNSFHDTYSSDNSPDFDFESDKQANKLHALAVRLEDQLQGTLLEDDALAFAGITDAVDDITEAIRSIYRDQFADQLDAAALESHDGPPYELLDDQFRNQDTYAEAIVRAFGLQLPDIVHPEQYEGLEREFVELVLKEVHNVTTRYELLAAIYATPEYRIDYLDEDDVEDIKTALTEVVLDPGTRNLASEFPDRTIETLKQDLWQELCEAELAAAQLDQFETTVTEDLRETFESWERDVEEEFDILVAYHRKRGRIQNELEKLDNACRAKANDLSQEVSAKNIGATLKTDRGESIDFRQLNADLEAVGLGTRVDQEQIRSDVSHLIKAKHANQNHNSGILSIFNNNSEHEETFDQMKNAVNYIDESPFELTSKVDNEFNVEIRRRYSDILDEVDEQYERAAESIRIEIEDRLTDSEGVIESRLVREHTDGLDACQLAQERGRVTRPERFFEESGPSGYTYLGTDGYVDLNVPVGAASTGDAINAIEETILDLEPGDIEGQLELKQELGLEELLGRSSRDIEPDELGDAPAEQLLEQFLEPVWDEQEAFADRLEAFGSSYYRDHDGLYHAIGRLERLADRRQGSDVDSGVELSDPHPSLSYGYDFVAEFEIDHHTITRTRRRSPNNALVRTREVTPPTLAGDPADIAESTIWEHDGTLLKRTFERHIDHLLNGQYDRLPVDLSQLVPTTGTKEYQELRMVNTYLSRLFDTSDHGAAQGFEEVSQSVTDSDRFHRFFHETDGYTAKRIGYGDEWTLSMVTFVSAFSLDQLEPVIGRDGYWHTYTGIQKEREYPWWNHVLGVAGEWDRWEALADRVREDEEPDWWPNGGAYIWRDEFKEPGEVSAMTRRLSACDPEISRVDTKEELLSLYNVDQFESTTNGQ